MGLIPDETDAALKLRAIVLARLEEAPSAIRCDLRLLEVDRGLGDFAAAWRLDLLKADRGAVSDQQPDSGDWILGGQLGPRHLRT